MYLEKSSLEKAGNIEYVFPATGVVEAWITRGMSTVICVEGPMLARCSSVS